MRDECEHGSLRRSCEVCERDNEIASLKAEVEKLTHIIEERNEESFNARRSLMNKREALTASEQRLWKVKELAKANTTSCGTCYRVREFIEAALSDTERGKDE